MTKWPNWSIILSMSTDPNTRTAAQNVKAKLQLFGFRRTSFRVRSQTINRAIVFNPTRMTGIVEPKANLAKAERCLTAAGLLVENHGMYLVVEA